MNDDELQELRVMGDGKLAIRKFFFDRKINMGKYINSINFLFVTLIGIYYFSFVEYKLNVFVAILLPYINT